MISNTATRKRIGNNIIRLIKEKKLSYRKLDQLTRRLEAVIDYGELNKIANGLKNITYNTLQRIADALEVDIYELVKR